MAEGGWKGVYHWVFGRSKQLSLNKFFDPSTPSMRKGRDGGKKRGGKKNGKKKKEKRRMKIVATTSLPTVDRPNADRWNADRWNADRSRQKGRLHNEITERVCSFTKVGVLTHLKKSDLSPLDK